ncbi:MAG: type II secretion system ATPase GspE [Armatimonadota bacterium]|nr:type II secretion system ATPase GspE [Armatimonadota bacterium]
MGRRDQRQFLGELLVEGGFITPAQLEEALNYQRANGGRLGEVLVKLGMADQGTIAKALGQQLGLQTLKLAPSHLREDVLSLVPEPLARQHRVIPISKENGVLTLGMVDPLDILAQDDIRRLTGLEVRPAVITEEDFHRVITQYPTDDRRVEEELASLKVEEELGVDQLKVLVEEAPVVRLVNRLITEAVRKRASDIHIEPQDKRVRVRYRIDGVLYQVMTLPKHIQPALVSRIKIMAEMDIAERRQPQDGRIYVRVDNTDYDIRVSTIPTVYGEKVVLRNLDRSTALLSLDRLGLLPDDLEKLQSIISKPYGMFLLTGPTGSGKTTTLYAILNRLNSPEVNILTVEDPVEYQLHGINQVQVNPKAGVTFARALRHFLRQDPDIIMVGEIRDEETARIAVQAALTGHLVLSTLHTNDAAGAFTRLLDMGIEPYLVSSSVIGAAAQRLVRTLCPRCKVPYEPTPELLARLGLNAGGGGHSQGYTFFRPVGCEECNTIGYRGRVGVFEILKVEEEIRRLITARAPGTAIKEAAIRLGMRTLQRDGIEKVILGITSVEEVLRVVHVEE